LNSELIRANHNVVLETLELCQNGDIIGDQLLLLDFDDFFYYFFQVKVAEILTELLGVNLSQREHVIDAKYEELGRRNLDNQASLHFFDQIKHLLPKQSRGHGLAR
jgi:hypothetical protein